MKKIVVFAKSIVWKFTSKVGDVVDNLFSGGTPFTPIALPPPFSSGAVREYEGMRAQQDYAYRQAYGAQQAGMMGGFGGQLLAQLMGSGVHPYSTGRPLTLKEGKVSVHVKFTRIDKEHVLVEVDCIQRVVHNVKELKEVTADLIGQYAEGYIFGEQPKSSREPVAKEPPGGTEGTDEKKA